MKRKHEDDEDETEAKWRRTECGEIIAHAFGPSQDVFLHLFLLDPTYRSAVALSRTSRAWNDSYKQCITAHVTFPLNQYLEAIKLVFDAFASTVAQPGALRLDTEYDLHCPSPREALPRFLLPSTHDRLVSRWLSPLPRTDHVLLCGHILVGNFIIFPRVLTEIFPGFRQRNNYYGTQPQYLDSTSPQRPRLVITLRKLGEAHWRAYIRRIDLTFPDVARN